MSSTTNASGGSPVHGANEVRLFWANFFAIVATAFGFVVRGQVIDEWGVEFNLNESQKGAIFGAGLWPFAVSIVLFSLVVDRIGYGKAMVFAFCCHVGSAIMTIFATNYQMLYWGTIIVALGNGTVEAVANPVVATMFPREKTKWLNILHAGWPGGLVLGGILGILATRMDMGWKVKVGLILLPAVGYGVMMLGRKWPVQERVSAGVSYKDMLKEAGAVGTLIVIFLIVAEVCTNALPPLIGKTIPMMSVQIPIALVLGGAYAAYVRSFGRPMFIFLLIIMIPLATAELGTDSWITPLMEPEMKALGLNAGWILIYTSFIMMVLRFFAGSIVHRISPLGLLAVSSVIAIAGLLMLSKATGIGILLAATLYACGKTFFWPTTLGVVSEQFPRGGALTINMIAGVGMIGVGIIGTNLIGNMQDRSIDSHLEAQAPAVHAQVIGDSAMTIFGPTRGLDPSKLAAASPEDQATVNEVREAAKKGVIARLAILPTFMLICYLILIFYFKSKGGYKAEVLVGHAAEDAKFTGGVEGPADV